jgi:hypothetical protein
MQKYFLILIICISTSTIYAHETDIESIHQKATTWAASCASLAPATIEVLANFVYFSYHQAKLDEQTRATLLHLKTLLPTITFNVNAYTDSDPTLQSYLEISKKLYLFNRLRYHSYASWQECLNYIASIDDSSVQALYQQLQNAGQQCIENYLIKNNMVESIITQLEHDIKQIHEHISMTLGLMHLWHTDQIDNIADHTDRALHINKQLQNIFDAAYDCITPLDTYQTDLIHIGTEFFYAYYVALYPHLPAGHTHVLFGPYGKLSESEQYFLPIPKTLEKKEN